MKKIFSGLGLLALGLSILPLTPPEAKAEIGCGATAPTVLLSEFSFNNTTNDFVELTVVDDGNHGLGQILKDYTITSIDTTVKKIPDTVVKTGDKLKFNDIANLTATTDQLVLTMGSDYLDAVCWTSTTPTDQEKGDFTKLAAAKAWNGTIENCLSSGNLEKNTSFKRKSAADANTATDWEAISPTASQTTTSPPTNTSTATSTASTSSSQQESPTQVTSSLPIATTEIIINEFLPDPEGSDDGNEWIELKNTSDHSVSLLGWQLDDEEGGSKPYTFGDITIGAESFLLLKNDKTNITLNNSADSVRLITPSGTEQEKIPYAKVIANQSWIRTSSNQWKQTKTLTPGEENISSEDLAAQSAQSPTPETVVQTPTIPLEAIDPTIIISEILPNPSGTDKNAEWIEIHNKSANTISLAGWRVVNGSGKTFLFPSNSIIPGNGYIILTDQQTKISLKNSADQIEILDPMGQIQNSISYEDAPENTSLAEIATIPLSEINSLSVPTPQAQPPQISLFNWIIPTVHAQTSTENPEQIPQDERETSWEWTEMITKGEPNPTFLKMDGQVIREPDSSNTFTLQTAQRAVTISFDPKKTDIELLRSILKRNATIKVKAAKTASKTGEENFTLENYTVKNELTIPTNDSNRNLYMTLTITTLLLMGGAIVTTKLYLGRVSGKELQQNDGVQGN